jgi:hypothetical protein
MLRINLWEYKLYSFFNNFLSKLKQFSEFKETDVLSLAVQNVQLNTA